MSHDYEGSDTEPMLGRPAPTPSRRPFDAAPLDPPDHGDAPQRRDERCRLCHDRGVYAGMTTGWELVACPRCAVDERRTA